MSDLRSALASLLAGRIRVTFHVETPLDLRPFAGFPLYGALKEHMMGMACERNKSAACLTTCLDPTSCAYGHLFETAADEARSDGGHYKDAPKPFVLHLIEPESSTRRPGERLQFVLVLFGERAAMATPSIAAALNGIAVSGLGVKGAERGLVRLAALEYLEPDGAIRPLSPDECAPLHSLDSLISGECSGSRFALRFETPLRLGKRGKWLNENDLDLADLATALVRRLDLLARFHGAGPLDLDREPFLQAAHAVTVTQRQLRWNRQDRHSTRHTRDIPMDGVTGRLLLEDVPPILADLLALGSLIHLGSKTTQGLGQIQLSDI